MSVQPKEVEFASCARMFTSWCNADHAGKPPETMQLQALEQLADIYAAALRLPGVDYRSSPEPPRLQPDERKRIGANLRNLPIQ
jgi:hypothetical protein